MNNPHWYHQTYRKLHLDWHQPPWIKKPGEFLTAKTAREQARMFKKTGIQAVEFFLYDHHGQAFFPSRRGTRHPNFKSDYPRFMIDALQEQKIKSIGYMNVLTSIHLSKQHPDWFIRKPDGSQPGAAWLTYPHSWICLASPYADEYFLPLVEEVLTRYPLDGLWLDALSWLSDTICHCPHCCKRFQALEGVLPPREEPKDLGQCTPSEKSIWIAWKIYRLGLITEFHRKIHALAQRLRPGIIVMDNCAGQAIRPAVEVKNDRFVKWVSASQLEMDALSCDPVPLGGNHEMILSFQGRYQITTGKAFDFMNERFHCWGEWQTRSLTDWKLEFATILANGGKCFFADNPYPDGTLEPRVYELLKEGYQFVKEREPICREAKPIYEIGILASSPSQFFGLPQLHDSPRLLPTPTLSGRLSGAHLAAIELGWQAHLFDEVTLCQNLDTLKCVIIPDQELIDSKTVEALKLFVQKGGYLWLLGGSGLYDEHFQKRAVWPFSQIAGLQCDGEWPAPVNYFRPSASLSKMARDLEILPVECWGRAIKFRAPKAKTVVGLSEPISDVWKDGKRLRENFQHHTVTGACPPSSKISGGGIFLNSYGKGKVLTTSIDLFTRYFLEGHRLLRGLIEACLETLYPQESRLVFSKDKPLQLETHLLSQNGKWIFHAVNYFSQKRKGAMVTNDDAIESRPFTVHLKVPFSVQKATLEPSGKVIPFRKTKKGVSVEVPSFALHSAVVLHEKKRSAAFDAHHRIKKT
ncbi:MAG: hypothetical protein V4507_08795 [Verrucomicrobiota bacterium]